MNRANGYKIIACVGISCLCAFSPLVDAIFKADTFSLRHIIGGESIVSTSIKDQNFLYQFATLAPLVTNVYFISSLLFSELAQRGALLVSRKVSPVSILLRSCTSIFILEFGICVCVVGILLLFCIGSGAVVTATSDIGCYIRYLVVAYVLQAAVTYVHIVLSGIFCLNPSEHSFAFIGLVLILLEAVGCMVLEAPSDSIEHLIPLNASFACNVYSRTTGLFEMHIFLLQLAYLLGLSIVATFLFCMIKKSIDILGA